MIEIKRIIQSSRIYRYYLSDMVLRGGTEKHKKEHLDGLTKAIDEYTKKVLGKQQRINNEVLGDKCDELEKMVTKARIEENEAYLKKGSWYTAEKRIAELKKRSNNTCQK